jgi:hypothetical protein
VSHAAHTRVARNEKKKIKNTEKKPILGKPRYRWKDNIYVHLKNTRYKIFLTEFIWLSTGTSGGLL